MIFITKNNAPPNWSRMKAPLTQLGTMIVSTIRRRSKRRAAKESLGKLSDKQLRDIGLTRNDVSVFTLGLPSNRGLELSDIAKSRSNNW